MESLVRVATGDDNVAVGISGFGSAQVGTERWFELAHLTGRTTYYLRYDAQTLPWSGGADMVWTPRIYNEMVQRWSRAREGALVAAEHLSKWLIRWTRAGRKVLVVGFSLGAYVAWQAIRAVPDELKPNIDLILLSAAVGDTHETWAGLDKVGHVVNAYSSLDLALKYLYSHVVSSDETPAAGLGPLVVSPLPNLKNVDLTDMIGRDHLWGSTNIMRIVRISLGCMWGEGLPLLFGEEAKCREASLSLDAVDRLYRWTFIDPDIWDMFGRAMSGDVDAVRSMESLDRWSMKNDRLLALLDAASTVASLHSARNGQASASRSQAVLQGMLRYWLTESPDLRHPLRLGR